MKYLSLFSGIEAATVAWHPLGWEPVGFSEIEPFPCQLLATHYPAIPNLGDVTKITEEQVRQLGPIDVVVFGAPCTDLSIAGKQKGFRDEDGNTTRSGLFFDAIRIFGYAQQHCGARFALWENVPGAFSSSKGRDFAEVVGAMAGLQDVRVPENGWGSEGAAVGDSGLLEWACLDAQWFGLAQRRNRVFVILDTGDWAGRPPILLERESLRGDTPPSRETRQDFTGNAAEGTYACSGIGEYVSSSPLRRAGADLGNGCESLVTTRSAVGKSAAFSAGNSSEARGIGYTEEGTPPLRSSASGTNQVPSVVYEEVSKCLNAGAMGRIDYETETFVCSPQAAVALAGNTIGRQPGNGDNDKVFDDSGACYKLTSTDVHGVAIPAEPESQVRRLTPTECEFLQGFPAGYTNIPFRGKPAADGNRYKALGNSMAVPVMRYIGQKIQEALDYPIDDLL